VSLQDVIGKIIEGQSTLRDEIEVQLRAGKGVSDDLTVRALARVLRSYACVRDGWIVDAFPTSPHQAYLCEKFRLVPQCVIHTAAVDGVAVKVGEDPARGPEVFAEAIASRTQGGAMALAEVATFYSEMHDCRVLLPPGGSTWERSAFAISAVWAATGRRRRFLQAQSADLPVPAAGLGYTPTDVQTRIGKFLDYCPVTLQENEALVKCTAGTALMVEYRGVFYKTHSMEKMQKLISNPEKYLHGVSLLTKPIWGRFPAPVPYPGGGIDPLDIALQMHCPVTLWIGPNNPNCVVPGSKQLVIKLGDLMFILYSKLAWQAFIEKPWMFADLNLPTKMPAARAVVHLTDLPARGYCEQTLARDVTAALTALAEVRPKYPGLSVEDSVLKFLALYLRSHNKRENDEAHELSQKLYDNFIEHTKLAEFLHTQPKDTPDYKEKQLVFERVRSKPWTGFDIKNL